MSLFSHPARTFSIRCTTFRVRRSPPAPYRFSGGRLFGLLACSLLIGCETVREARRVQASPASLHGEVTATAANSGLLGPDRSYTLSQLEPVALTNHPALFQARQARTEARLQITQIRASLWPQSSAAAAYRRATQNTGADDSSLTMRGSWSASVGLDLLVYDFGRLRARERQAIEALIAAEAQCRETELEVLYAIRAAFFEYHRSRELVRVAAESERQYAQHLEEVRVMTEVGTRRQYDVTKAEVDWGNARLDIITASNALVTARAQLNRALGLAEQTAFGVGHGAMVPADAPADELMRHARNNNPMLAVLHARSRAASAYVDQTIAELYPELSLGVNAEGAGRGFPWIGNLSWGLNAVQNLFDGHRKTARIEEAVARFRTARSQVAAAEQELYRDLVDALSQRASAIKRLEIANLVRRQTEENLLIVNEQYRVGLSSSIERTDAQVAVTQAGADEVRARYDNEIASALIARLLGETGVSR